jgi:hypothetical protein
MKFCALGENCYRNENKCIRRVCRMKVVHEEKMPNENMRIRRVCRMKFDALGENT